MRQIICILTLTILTSCGQTNSEQNISTVTDTLKSDLNDEMPKSNNTSIQHTEHDTLNYRFRNSTLFKLADTITADFNGDGKDDRAIFIRKKNTSGIIIKHALAKEDIRIGFGKSFAHLTDFNWADYWGLLKDKETFEIIIEDSEIIGERRVILDNPSIFIMKEEVGCGLITYRNGKYEWIHQTD